MPARGIQRLVKIKADANGDLPSRIHLMSAGHWHAPWHGNFEMTPEDLREMVADFDAGEAMVEGSQKLPINYGHDISGKAAGWITKLTTENDDTELWGDVTWTPEGQRMLTEEEFKYISPEWNPRSFPYQDPEDEDRWLNNVFTGAGLTNIPLFKKLKPVMASRLGSSESKQPKGGDMTLEEILAKKADERSAEEKAFLAEHKDELTEEQRKEAGLEEAPKDPPAADPKKTEEPVVPSDPQSDPSKQASATIHGLTAAQIQQLQADAAAGRAAQQELLRSNLKASVQTAIGRGAIKADQLDSTVDMLMASSEETRKSQLEFIEALPGNPLLAQEIGKDPKGVQASVEVTAEEREMAKAFNLTEEQIKEYKASQAGTN